MRAHSVATWLLSPSVAGAVAAEVAIAQTTPPNPPPPNASKGSSAERVTPVDRATESARRIGPIVAEIWLKKRTSRARIREISSKTA